MIRYLVVFEKTKTGYSAFVPDLPGVAASGDSKLVAEQNIYEAIAFHIEGLKEEGMPIPETVSESEIMVMNF